MSTVDKESHKAPPNGKPKRVQLTHLLLDKDFCDKPKIIALADNYSELAVFLLIKWLLAMTGATDGEISRAACRGLAKRTGIESELADKILNYCIDNEILSAHGADLISNARVIQDQERCAIKRETALQRQTRHRENTNNNFCNALVTRDTCVTDASCNALPTRLPVTDTDTVTVLDLKRGVQGGAPPQPPKPAEADPIEAVIAQLPLEKLGLSAPRCRASLRQWALNITTKHRKSFDIIGAEALVARYINRPKDFCDDLLFSTENAYKTVVQKPPDRKQVRGFERAGTVATSMIEKFKGAP